MKRLRFRSDRCVKPAVGFCKDWISVIKIKVQDRRYRVAAVNEIPHLPWQT